MAKLNLGCGVDVREGYLNVDKYNYRGVDKVVDLDKFPWPFKDNSFDEILAQDVLEHLGDVIQAISECYRILKPLGKLKIRVPHFTYRNAFDITHTQYFSSASFDFTFLKNDCPQKNFYNLKLFNKIKKHISFECRPVFFWNYFLQQFVNISELTLNFYERTPLRIFPATNINFILTK